MLVEVHKTLNLTIPELMRALQKAGLVDPDCCEPHIEIEFKGRPEAFVRFSYSIPNQKVSV